MAYLEELLLKKFPKPYGNCVLTPFFTRNSITFGAKKSFPKLMVGAEPPPPSTENLTTKQKKNSKSFPKVIVVIEVLLQKHKCFFSSTHKSFPPIICRIFFPTAAAAGIFISWQKFATLCGEIFSFSQFQLHN